MIEELQKRVAYLTALLAKLKKMKPDLIDVCNQNIGKDASPNDLAPDELGCAETVTTIVKQVYPNTPIMVSTWALYDFLRHPSNGWMEVAEPEPECIVISPTGLGKPGTHGHVGIVGVGGKIMSNSSFSEPHGLFLQNYTVDTWKAYFHDKQGFPVFYFKRVIK